MTIELINISHEIHWGLPISTYFYFTGMSAGSFIISSLYHVFGMKKFKPISRIALILATVLLMVAPLNLIGDLQQYGRFIFTLFRRHITSPMSFGVYLLSIYPTLCIIEGWFMLRADMVRYSLSKKGFKANLYKLFTLGQTDLSEKTLSRDKKITTILAALGVPTALAVHGYTGYILGVVRARGLWFTPMMPLTFLASAMVSGIGLLIILVWIMRKSFPDTKQIEDEVIPELTKLMYISLIFDMALVFLEVTMRHYGPMEESEAMDFLLYGPFSFTFVAMESIFGKVIPFIILTVVLAIPYLKYNKMWIFISSLMVVIGVYFMRYNFVVGGQSLPRSGHEILYYAFPYEHIAMIIGIFALAYFLFLLGLEFLPW
ncbi:MAG: NrfD/PsrC family molybdoenzyme membrane anchor subunit, partial [Methanosarcinales archaeon]